MLREAAPDETRPPPPVRRARLKVRRQRDRSRCGSMPPAAGRAVVRSVVAMTNAIDDPFDVTSWLVSSAAAAATASPQVSPAPVVFAATLLPPHLLHARRPNRPSSDICNTSRNPSSHMTRSPAPAAAAAAAHDRSRGPLFTGNRAPVTVFIIV